MVSYNNMCKPLVFQWFILFLLLAAASLFIFPVLIEASGELQEAIDAAEAAIEKIPDPVAMEDMLTVRIARHLVVVAVDLGAVEGDIGNIASLIAAEEAITNLFRQDFMRHSILDLSAPRMGDYNALVFVRNKAARWWDDDRAVNGMSFLPMGSLTSDHDGLDIPEGRWARYDISGRGYTLIKGYVGIDDFSPRQDYPVVFQIIADSNPVPIYEVEVDYGEYPAFYLLDIEGVDELEFRWTAADGTDSGKANQFVIVEPQFFIPINQDMLTAIDAAEAAIDALPAEIDTENEADVWAARAAVKAAYSLGVDKEEDRIGNLSELLAAEEFLEELFYENYTKESLHLLGDPGTDNRNSAWLISYDDIARWAVYDEPGTRGTANLRTFAPLKVFTTTWQNLHQTARYAQWDIRDKDYSYLEGHIGVSDITGQPGHPYNFTIYGDGEPLFEALLEYGRDAKFYRVNVEDVDILKIEFSAEAENVTATGWTAWPVYVEPHFLIYQPVALVTIGEVKGTTQDDTALVPVNIINAGEMAGGEFVITYDPDIVTPVGIEKGELLEAMEVIFEGAENEVILEANFDYAFDSFKVAWASGISVDEAGASTEGVLFKVEFAINAAGVSILAGNELSVYDADELGPQEIDSTWENGKITILELNYGDVNKDGLVNIPDAILTLRYIMGIIELDEAQQLAADVNGDGIIDINDAVLIIQYVLALINEFPDE